MPSTPHVGPRQILSALGSAVFGFFIAAAALHTAIRDPLHLHADGRSEKLTLLDRTHGQVFSAVFGSSHSQDGFDPHAFDQELAGSPIATRSFNFAVDGGSQAELRVLALQFVKQLEPPAKTGAPPEPCFVMLDLNTGANFAPRHLIHPRSIDIYDWRTTQFISRLVEPGMSTKQAAGRTGFALIASGLYYSNIGMLSNVIFSPPVSQELLDLETANDRRGQNALPENPDLGREIDGLMPHRPATPAIHPGVITAGHSALIAELAAASPVPGVSFVYFHTPEYIDLLGMEDFPDHLEVATPNGTIEVPVINLARPDRFPQFYDQSLWHDPGHLNAHGASLVSATFADQLKLWYAQHGLPHACGD